MLIRFFAIILFIPALILLIYNLLHRIIYNFCRKLSEPTPSLDDRLDEIDRRALQLIKDCKTEKEVAARRTKLATKIETKLKR